MTTPSEILGAHIRYTVAGCGDLAGFGTHPGTSVLVAFVVMGFVCGSQRGLTMAFVGAGFMLAAFGPPYLIGAHDRGKGHADALRRAADLARAAETTPETPTGAS